MLPVLVLILFGIIDYGLYFGNALDTRVGVASATRQAIVDNFDPTCHRLRRRFAAGSDSGYLACMVEARTDPLAGKTYVKVILPPTIRQTRPRQRAGIRASRWWCARRPWRTASPGTSRCRRNGVIRVRLVAQIEQRSRDTTQVDAGGADATPPGGMGLVVYRRKLRSGAEDGGAIAIIVALLSVVLFGFAALVVDIGNARQRAIEQGQSTVDAASLAGVRVLANGGPDVPRSSIGGEELRRGEHGTSPALSGRVAQTGSASARRSIRTLRRIPASRRRRRPTRCRRHSRFGSKLPTQHVQATFGGLFGVSSIGISPVAQALSGQPLPPECGPCDPALDESTGQPTPTTPADRVASGDPSDAAESTRAADGP